MQSLQQLTIDDFKPLQGERFTVSSEEQPIEMELVEVKAMGSGLREGGAFSLLWQGPEAPLLDQRIYRFTHAELGEHDLFIVPVAQKTSGFQYEVIFT